MQADFDLESFLWGDRVAANAVPTPQAQTATPAALTNPAPATSEPVLPTVEIDEPPQIDWNDTPHELREESDDLVRDDEYEIEEILEEDDLDIQEDDEPQGLDYREQPLGYLELGQRLRWVVLPCLQMAIERNGRLTLGNLAYSVQALQNSDPHLREVYDFVRRSGVPVLPSCVGSPGKTRPLATIEIAKRRFGSLLRGELDQAWALRRLGYEGVHLSSTERKLLVDAWARHVLARAEEEHYCAITAAEVERVGEDTRFWSPEALAAREALVLDNLWLVARVIRPYLGRDLDLEDLFQEGVEGLFRAVVKYDVGKTPRFMRYAANWVWQKVTRSLADDSRSIRLPVHVWEEVRALDAARQQLKDRTGHEPSALQLASSLGWALPRVEHLLQVAQPVVSLDSSDQFAQAATGMPAAEGEDISKALDLLAFRKAIEAVLSMLSPREREVLELRFGLVREREYTLEEVGARLGVTRERIRQIEDKAIKKLRRPGWSRVLSGLIERSPRDDRVRLPVLSPALVSKVLPSFPEGRERLAVAAMFLQPERRPGTLDRTLTDLNLTRSDAEALADRVKTLTNEWYRVNVLPESYKTPQTTQVEGKVS